MISSQRPPKHCPIRDHLQGRGPPPSGLQVVPRDQEAFAVQPSTEPRTKAFVHHQDLDRQRGPDAGLRHEEEVVKFADSRSDLRHHSELRVVRRQSR